MAQTGAWRSWRRWQKAVAIAAGCFFALSVIGIISTAVGGGGKKKTEAVGAALASPTLTSARTPALATIRIGPPDTPRPPPPTAAPSYDLALISASCLIYHDAGYEECQGFVQNVGTVALQNVTAVISLRDASDVPQASEEALIDYNPLLPGQQSSWKVIIMPNNPALTKWAVTFKDLLAGKFRVRDDRQH